MCFSASHLQLFVEQLELRRLLSVNLPWLFDNVPIESNHVTLDPRSLSKHPPVPVHEVGGEIHPEPSNSSDYVIEPFIQDGEDELIDEVIWENYDLGETFKLNSFEGADLTIYLDFDGHITTGTTWNSRYEDPIVTPAYTFEGDSSSFSDNELARIQRIWARVSEDFAPFHVNVTTEDPGVEALRRVGIDDSQWGIRVIFGANTWHSSAGGVAYIGSFTWTVDAPAFVFLKSEKSAAESASHEVGHTLGLTHDGRNSQEYYGGHGSGTTSWAPIMGVAYNQSISQWSKGEYNGANNVEDDLTKISSLLGYRTDDFGDSIATAVELIPAGDSTIEATYGIIEESSDIDLFSFFAAAGPLSINLDPLGVGANLDIKAEIRDTDGNIFAADDPVDQLDAHFNIDLPVDGAYFLSITGTGTGDPLGTGYSDYGSLGHYRISGNVTPITVSTNTPPQAVDDFAVTFQNQSITIPVLENDTDVDGDPLTVQSFNQGLNGTVSELPNGNLIFKPDPDFTGQDSFGYTASDGNGGTSSAFVNIQVNPVVVSDGPKLTTGKLLDVGTSDWTTVALNDSYESMIVIATLVYEDGNAPLVTRIRNAKGNQFDVRVQRADNLLDDISNIEVHYLVVEEGVYNQSQHGITMEAIRYTSTVTDENNGWKGEHKTYANTYAAPVVIGQVMSFNDPNFSVFWSRGNTKSDAPDAINLNVGKHVGEDPNPLRNDETVGYVVIETGSGTIGSFYYSAALGDDSVRGTSATSQYNVNGTSNVETAILSQAGMDGGHGSWAVLAGPTPVVGSLITLSVDEDTLGDAERSHTDEQVAYVLFEPAIPNNAPIAVNDSTFTVDSEPVVVSVLANDFDADGDSFGLHSYSQGTHGSVVENNDSTLTYSPNPGFVGIDTFTYTIEDNFGANGTATVTVTVSPNSLNTDELVGHWPMDGSTDDVAPYGQDNSGKLIGNGQFVIDGTRGQVLRFNDSNAYVDIMDSDDINVGIHGQRTISLWFNADDVQERQVLFEEGSSNRGMSIYLENGEVTVGGWNIGANQTNWVGTFLSSSTISAGQWHHVALTLDGGKLIAAGAFKGYVDGQLIGVGEGSQVWGHKGDIGIGRNDGSTHYADGVSGLVNGFIGLIDDVRVYNRSLTIDSILQLAQLAEPQTKAASNRIARFDRRLLDIAAAELYVDLFFANKNLTWESDKQVKRSTVA